MRPVLLAITAAITAVTAFAHSIGGERHLLAPLLAVDAPITTDPVGRPVIRVAWHFTSALLLMIAVVLGRAALDPAHADHVVLAVIGIGLLAIGLIDGIATRLRHFAWPIQTISGLLVLFAL